jgi:sterol desaturase/sphingolipid hydroxylase (fatty acid hydroxylase superfamily)
MDDYASYGLLAVVIGALLAVERLWPASSTQRGEWMNNVTTFALTITSQKVLVTLLVVAEAGLISAFGGGLFDLRGLPWGIGAVVYLVAMDLGEYLFHRAQHVFPWLWAMHSLHHSDRAVNVTTTQRHFWLEPALKAASIWLAVALMFKVDAFILGFYAVATLYHYVSHANIRLGFGPLSWLLNSPQYHRLHHSLEPRHYNANFAALLPIFDVVSGAYIRPARDEFPDTGLDECVTRPLDLVTWPVRGAFGTRPAKTVP